MLVEIGDRAVCARVMGHGPTVVLEAGGAGEGTTGTFSRTVEEQLAEFATVLTYDRVGSGRSGSKPRETMAEMADDLDALLFRHRVRNTRDDRRVVIGWDGRRDVRGALSGQSRRVSSAGSHRNSSA
jgi:hypothetical protein